MCQIHLVSSLWCSLNHGSHNGSLALLGLGEHSMAPLLTFLKVRVLLLSFLKCFFSDIGAEVCRQLFSFLFFEKESLYVMLPVLELAL